MSQKVWIDKPVFILSDLDGTLVPPAYFGKTLLPFFQRHGRRILLSELDSSDRVTTRDIIDNFARNLDTQPRAGRIPAFTGRNDREVVDAVMDAANWLIENKLHGTVNSMISLTLLIVMRAFEDGEMKGDVYPDVPTALYIFCERKKIPIYVITSGIVEFPILTLTVTQYENVGSMVSDFFSASDSKIGSKKMARTYDNILEEVRRLEGLRSPIRPREALFLTDDPREASAAKEAGWMTVIIERSDVFPLSPEERRSFHFVSSLLDIHFYDN